MTHLEFLRCSAAEFEFMTLGRTNAARYLAGLRVGRLRYQIRQAADQEGGTRPILCERCDLPFARESDWDARHDTPDGPVHEECCTACNDPELHPTIEETHA